MLSYQHGFHAGNLADLHKHLLFTLVLDYLVQKPAAMTVLDVYAGRGRYDLGSRQASKTGEAEAGIRRLWTQHWPEVCQPYRAALAAFNGTEALTTYPGSPLLAAHFLRDDDVQILCELHPQEFDALKRDPAVRTAQCHRRDAREALLALTPPPLRRGVCLVDPSYEVKSEYRDVASAVSKAIKRWPEATFLIWYPILASQGQRTLVDALSSLTPKKGWLRSEVRRTEEGERMLGSGMLVLNPPWHLAEQLEQAEVWLTTLDANGCEVICRSKLPD